MSVLSTTLSADLVHQSHRPSGPSSSPALHLLPQKRNQKSSIPHEISQKSLNPSLTPMSQLFFFGVLPRKKVTPKSFLHSGPLSAPLVRLALRLRLRSPPEHRSSWLQISSAACLSCSSLMLSSSSLAPPVARGVRASRSCRAVVISRTSSSSRALADFLYCVRRNDRARSDDAARVAPTCLGTCRAPVAKPAEVAVEAMVLCVRCVSVGEWWWVGGYVGRYVSEVGFSPREQTAGAGASRG